MCGHRRVYGRCGYQVFGAYDASEGCLSLKGERRTVRFQRIEVSYADRKFRERHATFTGFTAQIIQHEIDHFEGIII